MGPRFLPRLVNGPFDDPALYVLFRHQHRALLFDLGNISALAARDILKITHIFVSHTHMDHFSGFDQVLRLMLGRDKDLYLYGPQGFLANLEGKLGGYLWNLVESYPNRFVLHATELHPERTLTRRYPCHKGFQADGPVREAAFDGMALAEPALTVRAVHLDHGTPVLAFALEERFHIHINSTALESLGLRPGRWLSHFKELIYDNAPPQTRLTVASDADPAGQKRMCIGDLKPAIARISPGQRLAYITDVAGTPENLERMIPLALDADHLFVEAAFSDRHRDVARRKHHLTARQAGELARTCRVKQYHLFHYSPRYTDTPQLLEAEAAAAFSGDAPP